MKYLVSASQGLGFSTPEEAIEVLEDLVLPSFAMLERFETEKKILAGGLPVGERALVFIVEAASHEEVDSMLRGLPVWGALEWEVTPLQTFAGRAAKDRAVLRELKG